MKKLPFKSFIGSLEDFKKFRKEKKPNQTKYFSNVTIKANYIIQPFNATYEFLGLEDFK